MAGPNSDAFSLSSLNPSGITLIDSNIWRECVRNWGVCGVLYTENELSDPLLFVSVRVAILISKKREKKR